MAMRERYWEDQHSPHVLNEKTFFQHTLLEENIYSNPTLDDAKFLFFNLPSIIIVKGYALGFCHQEVKRLIIEFIDEHKTELQNKAAIKIKYR